MRFLVIVTNCMREKPELIGTLESVTEAGFDWAVVSYDAQRRGSWPNFIEALRLAWNQSGWDLLLILQDDIRIARGLREWLTEQPISQTVATEQVMASLYTCAAHGEYAPYSDEHLEARASGGWWELPEEKMRARMYGAVALMMGWDTAGRFLKQTRQAGKYVIESHVSRFCVANRVRFFLHEPSLVQHVGRVSSIAPANDIRAAMYRGAAENWVKDCDDFRARTT